MAQNGSKVYVFLTNKVLCLARSIRYEKTTVVSVHMGGSRIDIKIKVVCSGEWCTHERVHDKYLLADLGLNFLE